MSLHARSVFEAFVLNLPAVTLVRQWRDDSVAKLGGKIFALLDGDGGDIWFKCSEMSFRMLTELEGIRPAPYFARARWVAVSPGSALSEDEVAIYIAEAHRLVLLRLSRRVRADLGLAEATTRPELT